MKRRANGTGSVIKLSGNRRKPYEVRGPVKGYTDKGHPIFDRIGYAETHDQGLEMLLEYNKSPYDPTEKAITLGELFEKWKVEAMPKLGIRNQKELKSAYNHIAKLSQKPYAGITTYQMQLTIDSCGKGYATQGAIRNLWNHLDTFAFALDVINKKRSETLTAAPVSAPPKTPYSEDEIEMLWNCADQDPTAASVLILLYTGYRISEYLEIDRSTVNFEDMTIRYGIKSKSGKNRVVPIHSRIQSLVLSRFSSSDYLCAETEAPRIRYTTFRTLYANLQQRYEMNHTIHETRHTFRTRLDNMEANEKCMDLLMGHSSGSTGRRIYTHKTLDQLRETIELLK